MVASGLADRTEVSQYRLATHLLLACFILVALVWTAQRLAARTEAVAGRIRATAIALVALILLQIYLGGIVAGLRRRRRGGGSPRAARRRAEIWVEMRHARPLRLLLMGTLPVVSYSVFG